ncbi:MAG: hypothetical protein AAF589_05005 [Planctomycetota bacterium]
MNATPRTSRTGTSLIEVAVSTLLIGIVLVAALDSTGSAVRTTTALSQDLSGETYAAELLEEIMAMPYYDPEAAGPDENFGIEADEPSSPVNRLSFDDIDDYDGWTEGAALAWRSGAARMDTAGWGRVVAVGKIGNDDPTTLLGDNAIDSGARRITVTVTSPSGEVSTLQALRSLGGAMQQAPLSDTTYVTGVLLDISATGGAVSEAVSVLNHASAP